MKFLLSIFLVCLPLNAFAGDFDAWYFKFLSVERKVVGETLSAEGKVVGTFTGKSSGEVSADGKSFSEKFEYFYMPEEHRVKEALVWKKNVNGGFQASAEFPAGNRFSCELTIKDEKNFILKTTFENGGTCVTAAELKDDGVLHAVDTAKDAEGNLIFTLKYTKS